jgi:tetratricopeptide (TPR) repeat protein
VREKSPHEQALEAERLGQFGQAFRLFQESLEHGEHNDGDTYFHCGWCLEQDEGGDKQDALHFYQKAADLAHSPPCKMNSLFRAGWLLMQAKEYAKAATMFRCAIDYGEMADHRTEIYHDAVFWHAVCLESQGRYLDALKWYLLVQRLSPKLYPESRFRELVCLSQVGLYREAFQVCLAFDDPPPAGFENRRYDELRALVHRERENLSSCVSDNLLPAVNRSQNVAR